MNWKTKTATTLTALGVASGALLATAAPASATITLGGCTSGYLCVYSGTNFGGTKVIASSTNSCFVPHNLGMSGITSYVSNLPVNAYVYRYNDIDKDYDQMRTFNSGGYSSSIGIAALGTGVAVSSTTAIADQVCEGSAVPTKSYSYSI
ncbi:peptidase inhibitor family I36 protein [Streptacidiphilus melanogenes]|uniref:peptidase inhibitor family I36 protein n=1 Tax=Streptacidiphilus melanogenes TaxID=411235 RepID=UPI0005A8938B|nr:peptidase inhibitor family I36 protein [Streptacidiphilus melanogenes]